MVTIADLMITILKKLGKKVTYTDLIDIGKENHADPQKIQQFLQTQLRNTESQGELDQTIETIFQKEGPAILDHILSYNDLSLKDLFNKL